MKARVYYKMSLLLLERKSSIISTANCQARDNGLTKFDFDYHQLKINAVETCTKNLCLIVGQYRIDAFLLNFSNSGLPNMGLAKIVLKDDFPYVFTISQKGGIFQLFEESLNISGIFFYKDCQENVLWLFSITSFYSQSSL